MLFAQKWPKLTVFESLRNISYFSKRCENDPKSIKTMGYSPCFLLKNGQNWQFSKASEIFRIFPKGVKMTQNRSKPWAIAHAFCSKMAKIDSFRRPEKYFVFLQKYENDPKSIKTMGYSPCFLLKNGQNWQFFKASEILPIFPKGVKMTQNRSKPWAIAHAFCSKMAKIDSFRRPEKYFLYFQKVWKWPKIDQNHGL